MSDETLLDYETDAHEIFLTTDNDSLFYKQSKTPIFKNLLKHKKKKWDETQAEKSFERLGLLAISRYEDMFGKINFHYGDKKKVAKRIGEKFKEEFIFIDETEFI